MRSDGIEVFFTCRKSKIRRHTSRKPVRGTNGNESMGAHYCHDDVYPRGAYLDDFLMSRVGQVWDSVYSEICQRADLRSRKGLSFRRWVGWRVALHSFYDPKGKIKIMHTWGMVTEPSGFYVDPEGFLRFAPYPKRHFKKVPQDSPEFVKINDTSEYRKIDGIWYFVRFQWVLDGALSPYQRYLLNQRGSIYLEERGKSQVILEKKQLSKKQLRSLKLRR